MTDSKKIAPSILSADFSKLGDEVRAVAEAGADWIHVDVMDGHFVPNITVGPLVVKAVRKITRLPIDVHLMIENPEKYVEDFITAGANWVSIHVEEGYHHDRTLNLIRGLGAKAGLALNPATPIKNLEAVIGSVDYVLIMTVNPGFGGQKFIPYCRDKINELKKIIVAAKKDILIEVDGGVNQDNIKDLAKRGADVFVAGSAIFGSPNYKETMTVLKTLIA